MSKPLGKLKSNMCMGDVIYQDELEPMIPTPVCDSVFRIVKKHYRDEDTKAVKHYYVIEEKVTHRPWFGSPYFTWEAVTRHVGCGEVSWDEEITFDHMEPARKCLNDLRREVPDDEIFL